jgi:GntR family transcriptional regulator
MHLMIQGIRPIPTCQVRLLHGQAGVNQTAPDIPVTLTGRAVRVVGTDGETMAQNQPMYRYIADDLRAKIAAGSLAPKDESPKEGKLRPNDKLPTEGELSEQYDASRNTVREAIRRLTDEGLLESRPGQGTFVARKADPFVTVLTTDPKTGFGGGETVAYRSEVEKTHREPTTSLPRVEVVAVSSEVAPLLRTPPGSQVVSRSQDRFIDGVPWSRQTTFYLMDFITKGATNLLMAKDIEGGAVQYLADEIGVKQTGYRDWITGRLASEEEQAFFGIGHNAAVFVDSRVAFDQNNKPMRLTVTVLPVDRNQLIFNVGPNVPALIDD